MNDIQQDSIEHLTERLVHWLAAKMPGASDVLIDNVVEPAQGFSSKTILLRATWRRDGQRHERHLVARIERETGCPFLADVFHQYRTMQAAAGASDVAVPNLFMAEADPAFVGAPFFLMDRVEGRVPSDFPSYHDKGWVAGELDDRQRGQIWWNGVREMEKLHRIGWSAFPFLANGTHAPPGSGFYLEHFIGKWFHWAAEGRSYPLLEDALRHLIAHQPAGEQPSLVWNDARMGNVMFAPDFSVASLFDFEVATLGAPEIDLGWWLYADDIFTIQFGVPRISGIPDRATAIRGFEQIYGRSMPRFDYYEAIAALKHAVISIREYSNGKRTNASSDLPKLATDRLSQYLNQHA